MAVSVNADAAGDMDVDTIRTHVARAAGIPTYHVERVDELQADLFAQNRRAGLTAGASTPKSLIDAAEERLASL